MQSFRPFSGGLNAKILGSPSRTLQNYHHHQQQQCRQGAEAGVSNDSCVTTRSGGVPAAHNNSHRPRTKSSSLDCDVFSPLSLKEQHGLLLQKSADLTTMMKSEVDAAVDFLTYLLAKARFGSELAEAFRRSLTHLLMQHYDGHWYPTEPLKGSGYRCLRVNGVMHPLLAIAADLSSIPLEMFRKAFPAELTIWIDPGDVNVRFGEEGSIGVYFAKSASMSSLCSSTNTTTTTTPSSLSSSPVGHHQLLTSSHSLVATTPGRRQRPLATSAATPNPVARSLNVSPTRLFPSEQRQSPPLLATTAAPPSDTARGSSYQLCGNVHLGASSRRQQNSADAEPMMTSSSSSVLLPLVESATA